VSPGRDVASLQSSILTSSEGANRGSLNSHTSKGYADWRSQFATERLRLLYYLGLIANPVFIAADLLLHREYLDSLLLIRSILEVGLLSCFFLLRRTSLLKPTTLVVLWVVIGNFCIVHMTVVLGGFTSTYYSGLNLVFLAAAVIVPISWPSHLIAQVACLAYYYAVNFLHGTTPEGLNAAIENSFFLVWTCVALLFSVSLYERLQRAEFQARQSEGKARRDLETSNQKLLDLDRLKSEFFANISHELRTPLTLTLGAFKTLLKISPGVENESLLQTGLRNTSRLLFMINELLDLAKLDSGLTQLRKRRVDLAVLIQNVAANFESSQKSRVHTKGLSQPVIVEIDPRQMKKVFYNLFSNAFKFSDPDEGQIWIRVHVIQGVVELDIEDNGIGIPPTQLQRIFERFTQVEGSASRRYEGSGIGLALAKEIVTLHGGTISVESEMGRGSTFTLKLPCGQASNEDVLEMDDDEATVLPLASQTQDEEAAADIGVLQAKDNLPLVLVVDDNADMRRYLNRLLRTKFRIVLAKDGVEALEQAKSLRPALILTDGMMPRMSGYDLLKVLRSEDSLRSIPVIFLTARAGTVAHVESLEAGADDYIAKPFDENELLARVGNLIRTRAQERELRELQKEKMAQFLPPHVADMIVSGDRDEFLNGHRAEISVAFVDLRGFTAYAETAQPEELMVVLKQYQSAIGEVVSHFKGTLERFSGDAIMIFFNDPMPVPNHMEQATRMALVMRGRLEQLASHWNTRGIKLGAGIGLAAGYATLGVIGFEQRHDYAAIGGVTNLAARLCSEAQHGQILVSEEFLQGVEDVVDSESVGKLTLKGFQQARHVYNIIRLKEGVKPSTVGQASVLT
jgi:signal transduction histidine kinase/class 3 adenylate cyclase